MTQSVIGALRVTLGLDSAEFTRGVQHVQSSTQRMAGQMRAVAAGVAAVGAGLAAAVRGQLAAAEEAGRHAQQANATAAEFQRAAAAARSVGIESAQLSDIYRDMSDRVGDFLATGGGPMADFFENIAPQVGLTAEAFRDLSGPQALQLFVSALEQAGVSSNEMTFYLEALSSGATRLWPLLRNGGAEMNRLGEAAAAAGLIMSEDTITASQQFSENLRQLADVARGFVTVLTANLAPVLVTVTDALVGLSNNLQRIGTYAAVAVAAFGTRFVVAFAAARLATVSLSGALILLRANLIRTGIGVLIIGAGELAYRISRLIEATGGFGEALSLLGEVARGVWSGMVTAASAIGPGLNSVWQSIKADFLLMVSDLANSWATFLGGLGRSVEGVPGFEGIAEGLFGAASNAVRNSGDLAADAIAAGQAAEAAGRAAGERVAEGFAEAADAVQRLNAVMARNAIETAQSTTANLGAAAAVNSLEDAAGGSGARGAVEDLTDGIEEAESRLNSFASRFASFVGPILRGTQSIGEAFSQMFRRMAEAQFNAALTGIGQAVGRFLGFGGPGGGFLSGLLSFDGGGYTGNGARSGGLDGKGGFLGVLHPRETVIDHTRQKGAGDGVAIIVNVEGANGDQHVRDLVEQGVSRGLAAYDDALPDRLERMRRDPRFRS